MKTLVTIALAIVLTACTVYPAQHHAVQPEVVMNYKWWNNLVEQPVAWIELRNTTPEAYRDFTLHVKTYDANGKVITAFDLHKPFALPGGGRRGFRVTMPGHKAQVVKVFMVGYDGFAPNHEELAHLEMKRE